jgi:carbonic anhydrase/acetyltransferase-like protein (isoleucine patch superfamily)
MLIVGTGQMADLCQYYFEKDTFQKVDAFVSVESTSENSRLNGRPIIQLEELENDSKNKKHKAFVAISYHQSNQIREHFFGLLMSFEIEVLTYVSPKATIHDDVEIGLNCLILENSVIQKGTTVRDNTFLWTGVQIGHHSTIEENAFIGASSVLMGCNLVGRNSHVSANCTVLDHSELPQYTSLGPGQIFPKLQELGEIK